MATKQVRPPRIADVDEMPERRRGRPQADLGPLKQALEDSKPHALEDVKTDQQRKFWRRRLRRAAQDLGIKVETRFVNGESRLYFQGVQADQGAAVRRRPRRRTHT
jgi:hypothetical protein